jgi:hypothetical protein
MSIKLPNTENYRSTPGQFAAFAESTIWSDMRQEISAWISDAHTALENPELTPAEVSYLQGCIRAARDLQQLPTVIVSIMEKEVRDALED